jgi:hypothetical protein
VHTRFCRRHPRGFPTASPAAASSPSGP